MGVNQVLETVPLISVLMLIGAEVGGGATWKQYVHYDGID